MSAAADRPLRRYCFSMRLVTGEAPNCRDGRETTTRAGAQAREAVENGEMEWDDRRRWGGGLRSAAFGVCAIAHRGFGSGLSDDPSVDDSCDSLIAAETIPSTARASGFKLASVG